MAFFPFGFVLRSFVWKLPVNPHLHVSCCYFLAFLILVIILVISTCILLLFLCLVILFLRGNHSTLIGQRCYNILQWRMKLTFIESERSDCAKCDMHTGAKSNFSSFLSNIHWNRNSFFHSFISTIKNDNSMWSSIVGETYWYCLLGVYVIDPVWQSSLLALEHDTLWNFNTENHTENFRVTLKIHENCPRQRNWVTLKNFQRYFSAFQC